MLLRRSHPADPEAAARVAAILGQFGGGWQPPPLPDDGVDGTAWQASDPPAAATPPRDDEQVGEPAEQPAEHEPAEHEPAEHEPAEREPAAGHAAERSWAASVVPGTLRGGRLDPGARGVAALIAVAVLAAACTGAVVLHGRPNEVAAPAVAARGVPLPGTSPSPSPTAEVVVAVAGTVRSPGLVRLPAGSRVDDAVRAAGGLLPGASYGLLNLARRLVDGEQVLVGVDPPAGAPAAAGGPASAGGLLDLNAATASDLDALPGIGPVLAQRIVDWRAENGRFQSVDQLREVTGIGESKYADLEDKVTV